MKSSEIIAIVALIIAIAVIGIFLNNENSKFKDFKMYPDREEYAKPSIDVRKQMFENRKDENRNEILMVGVGILAVIIIGFIIVKADENKKDPVRNLATLKDKNIITQSEYKEKIEYSRNTEIEKRILETKKREYKKLVSELDNLRAKGILTEEEYQQKLIKIKEKTT